MKNAVFGLIMCVAGFSATVCGFSAAVFIGDLEAMAATRPRTSTCIEVETDSGRCFLIGPGSEAVLDLIGPPHAEDCVLVDVNSMIEAGWRVYDPHGRGVVVFHSATSQGGNYETRKPIYVDTTIPGFEL